MSQDHTRGITIVPATEGDAPRMGRLMVETWLTAHRGQIPEGQWQRRRLEWTPEVSARGWARTINDIRAGALSGTCVYLAVAEGYADNLVGVVMAARAGSGSWDDAGEVFVLYVRDAAQGHGIGSRLLSAAVDHLITHGMHRVVIRCLETNAPANAFYEHLGGKVIGHTEIEDYGYTNVERIYGWQDARILLA